MSSNQTLLQKADIAIADLASNGGLLQPEENAQFVRKMLRAPTMIRDCRVVEMMGPERKINKIGFNSRILRKAVQGTALTSGQRSKATTSQITLTTKEVIAEIRLPYDVLEDNIERATAATNSASNTGAQGGLKDTLISMIAERAAVDLEELCVLADTAYTSGDQDDQDYMSLFDGWLTRAEAGGAVVDAANAPISKEVFKTMKQALPDEYIRVANAMRFYVSHDNETEYRDQMANRGTGLGDTYITTDNPVPAYGAPVKPASYMPGSKALYTNPMNLILGIQRQFSMEFDKDITTRVYIIVLTARVCVQIEEATALVIAKNLSGS